MIIEGNYSNFAALKAALGATDITMKFYDNGKSVQFWITTTKTQVCLTIPKNPEGGVDLDPDSPIVVQTSIREFTMEKKKGQTFMALWIFNGNPAEDKEILATF